MHQILWETFPNGHPSISDADERKLLKAVTMAHAACVEIPGFWVKGNDGFNGPSLGARPSSLVCVHSSISSTDMKETVSFHKIQYSTASVLILNVEQSSMKRRIVKSISSVI